MIDPAEREKVSALVQSGAQFPSSPHNGNGTLTSGEMS